MMLSSAAFAETSIEASVSRSRLAVGEELTLDIIVNGASGKISKPAFSPFDGFNSYSQGHSQEISIVNGQMSSRSIFTYILIANSEGKKKIGPFDVNIGGKNFKVPAVDVEVMSDPGPSGPAPGRSPLPTGPSSGQMGTVYSPPPRALPGQDVSDQDIFVKAWVDKDEAFINEPVIMTYTIYTRLSATYKGFEKEPVTTGFWIEEFPPEKTPKRTEQLINGSRYVVADVRKIALFPTEAGVFTVDPGTLSTIVEVRNRDDFDSFFSSNIFGRRNVAFPSSFVTQVYSRPIPTDKVTLVVKALPEQGRPASFKGAVGEYSIDSSVDKKEVQAGDPVTFRVKVRGKGNLNTVQTPALTPIDGFKIYDSSSSANIAKDDMVVAGEKVTETVLVPKKAGEFTIPALKFSYFDPSARAYRELTTREHRLNVRPGTEPDEPSSSGPSSGGSAFTPEPFEKQDVSLVEKDIRYIKTADIGEPYKGFVHRTLFYGALNFLLFALIGVLAWLLMRGDTSAEDRKISRLRSSHRTAKNRLRQAHALLKKGLYDEFCAEISRALYGYYADKLGLSDRNVTADLIAERLSEKEDASAIMGEIKQVFDAISMGRFGHVKKDAEAMKKIYELADRVITRFEKVKLK